MKIWKRILIISLVTILIALAGLGFIRNLIDFPVYHAAGRSLISGRTDLYSPDFSLGQVMDYRYLPFFLLLFVPLWLLPYKVAAYVWYLMSTAQIAGCFFLSRSIVSHSNKAKFFWIIPLLAIAQYVVMILHYGNAHLLAVFLLFASFYLFLNCKDFSSAVLMALSITIKLTPILLLPYFALKKRWKFLIVTASFLVILNLVPALYFGFGKNAELLNTWYHHVIVNQEFHELNGPINLSLKGQLRRYFSHVDYSQRVDGDTRYPAINIASFDAAETDVAWMLLSSLAYISALSFMWWLSSKKDRAKEEAELNNKSHYHNREAFELAIMTCLMLFIGPLTSKIYFIALLWPIVCLASYALISQSPGAKRAKLALILISFMNVVLPLLPGRSIQRLLLVLGFDFYLNCLLMLVLAYILFSQHRAIQESSAAQQKQALLTTKTS